MSCSCSASASGLVNGLLITQLKLQPFLVTLCGMFVYRGLARLLGGVGQRRAGGDRRPPGVRGRALNALRYVLVGQERQGALVFPAKFVLLLVLAAVVGFFLHRTAYGRYWYAIGHNELAAKYAGVNVNRQRIVVYVVCSALAALGGVLLFLDSSDDPVGQRRRGLELYAILGAVLGGCSLAAARGRRSGWCSGRWSCRSWKHS